MTQTAIEARRLIGKVVLFLALCWLVVLIAGVSGALQGASFKPMNVALAIIPGVAFLPAAFYSVQLHRTSDATQITRLWPKALVFGTVGLALLVGAAYML